MQVENFEAEFRDVSSYDTANSVTLGIFWEFPFNNPGYRLSDLELECLMSRKSPKPGEVMNIKSSVTCRMIATNIIIILSRAWDKFVKSSAKLLGLVCVVENYDV